MTTLSYKYRLLPTTAQIQQLAVLRKQVAHIWNVGLNYLMSITPNHQAIANYNLAYRRKEYIVCPSGNTNSGKKNAFYHFIKINNLQLYTILFAGGRSKCPTCLTNKVLSNLVVAWECYLAGDQKAKCPRYKTMLSSIGLTGSSASIYSKRHSVGQAGVFRLPPILKLDELRYIHHRDLGSHKAITISHSKNKWWVSFTADVEVPKQSNSRDIGIDVGVNSIVADSRGITIKGAAINGRLIAKRKGVKKRNKKERAYYSKKSSKLAQMRSHLSKMKKDGSRYRKLQTRIQKIEEAIVNRQLFHEHRIANTYSNYVNVVMEDIKVSNLTGNKTLNSKMRQLRIGSLISTIKYKTEAKGNTFSQVHPAYTSQTCNCCGDVDKNNRRGETYTCSKCGHIENADINAAKNILARFYEGKAKKKKPRLHTSVSSRAKPKRMAGTVAQPDNTSNGVVKIDSASISVETLEVIRSVQYTGLIVGGNNQNHPICEVPQVIKSQGLGRKSEKTNLQAPEIKQESG